MKKDFVLEIYKSKNTVFNLREIALLLGDTNLELLKSKIHYYIKRGVIRHLRRGIYVKPDYDVLELAAKIYTPSYISLETVLQAAGAVFQYYSTIFVISYLSRRINVGRQEIVYRKIKYPVLLNREGIEFKDNYAIATKERAFLDTLYLYKNYHFDNLKVLDRAKITKLLDIYKSKTLKEKVGEIFKDNA